MDSENLEKSKTQNSQQQVEETENDRNRHLFMQIDNCVVGDHVLFVSL